MPWHHNTILPVVLVVDVNVYVYIIHIKGVHHIHHSMLSKITSMIASQKPNELAAWNKDEKLSLVRSDLISVLKGNYAGEVGQFVCYTKAKVLVTVYDTRVSHSTSVLDHAWKASEINKIFPWDNSCPLPEFFFILF